MANHKKPAADSLSEDALQHFKTYKYSAVDKSPISNYILKYYWNACVQFLPLWLAPNMVTLIGFFFIIGNVGLQGLMDPDLVGPKERWVYYSYAFGVWAYSTMDNMDGKQARRTGTSSGLGELFDHGIDSLNCTLASLLQTSAMGLGATKLGAYTALVPTLPMFFSTWETYHTHTLYLGYFNGPTEGLILASTFMLISGTWGPQIWREPLSGFVGYSDVLRDLTPLDLWIPMILIGFFIIHVPACIWNVATVQRERKQPFGPALLDWTPMVVFVASSAAWLGSPYTRLLRDNHLCLLCVTLSFVFGRMTTKIILAHLTRQPFPRWTALLAPLMGGAILVNMPLFGFKPISASTEQHYLWAYFGIAVVVYFRWAYLVINAICDYLGIRCFTIPEEKWRLLQSQKSAPEMNGLTKSKAA